MLAAFGVVVAAPVAAEIPRDTWPCALLLCLANPAGPKAEGECVPPINWLYSLLRRGKPFPTCAMDESKGDRAVLVTDYFDPCPAPLQVAPAGSYVALGRLVTAVWKGRTYTTVEMTSTPQMAEQLPSETGFTLGQRACVGNLLGNVSVGGADAGSYTASVYDSLTWLPPQASPNGIDVYSGNVWQMRIRY